MEINFSPLTCIFENRPPGTLITGVPGSGKTYLLQNLAANTIEQSARIFVLDAKNDMLPVAKLFPNIKVVDVNNITPGSLDPFLVFGNDVDVATILTVVEIMSGELTPEEKHAITPIIQDFVNKVRLNRVGKGASFREFVDYLYQNPNQHAQMVGNSLFLNENSKYGPLIFGDIGQKNNKLRLKNQSTIISILGMALPSGSKHIKPDEMVNAAIVYIICKMIKDLLVKKDKNDKTPTLFMLDECHMLLRSSAIADIIDEFLVLGRSLGVAVCMASQNVTHFPSSIAQMVSNKICFRLSKQESEEFFQLFNNTSGRNELAVSESIDIVTRLKTGYCFCIDGKNRVGFLHVLTNYGDEFLSSNPLEKKNR